jgi:hypothetical protein
VPRAGLPGLSSGHVKYPFALASWRYDHALSCSVIPTGNPYAMSATGKWYTRHIQQKAQQRNSLRQRVMHFHFAHVTPAHIRQGLYIQTLSEPLRAIEQNRAEKAVPVMKLLLDDLRHWNIGVAPPIFERGIDLAAFGEQPIILVGIGLQIAQLVVSIRRRDQLRDETGRTSTSRCSPISTAKRPIGA